MLGPHHLLKEPFRRANVAFRAEHELNGTTFFVNGAIQILARLPDLNIYPSRRAAHLQVLTHTFIDLRSITLYPTKNR